MRRILLVLSVCVVLVGVDVNYDLVRGWNMVSLPCVPEDGELSDLFPFIPPAYSYNPTTMAYSAVDGIPDYTLGFWMLVEADTSVTVTCESPWTEEPPEPDLFTGTQIITGADFDSVITVVDMPDGGYAILTQAPDTTDATGMMKTAIIHLDEDLIPVRANLYDLGRVGAAVATDDMGLCIAGIKSSADVETFIVRLDSTGAVVWAKSYISPATEGSMTILHDTDGSIILVTGSQMLRLDDAGDTDLSIGLPFVGQAIFKNGTDGYLLIGRDLGGTGDDGVVIAQMSSTGTISDIKLYSGVSMARFSTFEITPSGDIYGGGFCYEGAVATGKVFRLSPTGTVLFARAFMIGPELENTIADIKVEEDGSVAVTGNVEGDMYSVVISGDGVLEGSERYIGTYVGIDDSERAIHIASSTDGLRVFGYKSNWGVLSQIVTIDIRDGSSCTGQPLDMTLMDSDFSSTPTSASGYDLSLDVYDITVEMSVFGVRNYSICR